MKDQYMARAIELALENVRSGKGGPFGAVVVKDGAILATGTNLVTSAKDPTAHAEVVAIRGACSILGAFQLSGCDLYSTSEPCPMCLGAVYWAHLDRVFYGSTAADAAAAGFDDAFIYRELSISVHDRKIPFVSLMRAECLACFDEWTAKSDRVAY